MVSVRQRIKGIILRFAPVSLGRLRCRLGLRRWRWGDLRRNTPISTVFGLDRGQPIDRYYIERFLDGHRDRVRGVVLEVAEDTYARRYGNSRIACVDVLHCQEGNAAATLVGDLVTGHGIPDSRYDCIILTQVLQFVTDMRAALATCRRALRPGGTILATWSGISPISTYDYERWGEYWRVTDQGAASLAQGLFSPGLTTVETWGNVVTAIAFLHGLAAEELKRRELDHRDPRFPVLVTLAASLGQES